MIDIKSGMPSQATFTGDQLITEINRILNEEFGSSAAEKTSIAASLLGVHNPNFNFIGFAKVGDATPTHINNTAWIAQENGTIFGIINVNKGQIISSNGVIFIIENASVYKDSVTLRNHNPFPFSDNNTRTGITGLSGYNGNHDTERVTNTIFDYVGTMNVATNTLAATERLQMRIYPESLISLYNDPEYSGKIYVLIELASSVSSTKSTTISILEGVGTIVSGNPTLVFEANRPTLLKLEFDSTNITSLRVWINYATELGEKTYLGRVGVFVKDVNSFNTTYDTLKQDINFINEGNSRAELSGYYGWKALENGVFNINPDNNPNYSIIKNDVFPYDGNMLQMGDDTFYFQEFYNIKDVVGLLSENDANGILHIPTSLNVELWSDIDQIVYVKVRIYDSVESAIPYTYMLVELKAGISKIAYSSFYLRADYDSYYQLYFEKQTGSTVKIGRFAYYNDIGIKDINNKKAIAISEVGKHQENYHLSGLAQEYWGDSLTVRMAEEVTEVNNDVVVTVHGFGGHTSTSITEQFLATTPDPNKFYIFWQGRNNNLETSIVVADVKRCVAHLGTQNYLVLGVTNADFAGEYITDLGTNSRYDSILEINKRLALAYQERFFDVRNFIVNISDFGGIYLSANFVQPTVGANVQIQVQGKQNDSSWFGIVGRELVIGALGGIVGEYTVISYDSATLMTIRLDVVGSVSEGATVENTLDVGGVYTKWKQVLRKDDFDSYHKDIAPASLRDDETHFNSEGSLLIAKKIRNIINTL